jgi:hypothetical protein
MHNVTYFVLFLKHDCGSLICEFCERSGVPFTFYFYTMKTLITSRKMKTLVTGRLLSAAKRADCFLILCFSTDSVRVIILCVVKL